MMPLQLYRWRKGGGRGRTYTVVALAALSMAMCILGGLLLLAG